MKKFTIFLTVILVVFITGNVFATLVVQVVPTAATKGEISGLNVSLPQNCVGTVITYSMYAYFDDGNGDIDAKHNSIRQVQGGLTSVRDATNYSVRGDLSAVTLDANWTGMPSSSGGILYYNGNDDLIIPNTTFGNLVHAVSSSFTPVLATQTINGATINYGLLLGTFTYTVDDIGPSGSTPTLVNFLPCLANGTIFGGEWYDNAAYRSPLTNPRSQAAYSAGIPSTISIPEPSTLALLGMGGIGLIACSWRRRKAQRIVICLLALLVSTVGLAQAVTIDMVPVGNVGNSPDSNTGNLYGSVDYSYAIGKYEVTAGQYAEFLNKVAATDAFALYDSSMWSNTSGCKIQRSGTSGSFTYSVAADYANRPVNYVSWGDAARFMNWLENGQKTYAQDPLTTENGSYTLGGHTDSNYLMTVVRNPGRQYYIPTENEWYKAAYYDPNKGGTGGYWLYPTKSDAPNAPGQDMTEATHPGNNANCSTAPYIYPIDSGHYTTVVGEFQLSASAYGTFDQGGNVWEWHESLINSRYRGTRGGSFYHNASFLASSTRFYNDTSNQGIYGGFRVASVPEPGCLAMLLSIAVGGLIFWRRRTA